MQRRLLLGALIAIFVLPTAARADSPRIASDGFYIGARLEPGTALALAYDLEVYVTRDRLLAVGPAASFSFLGQGGVDLGRRQDYLLAVDVLRLKVELLSNDWLRFYTFVGGGFSYARLPAQESSEREVVLTDGSVTTARLRYPEQGSLGGLVSVGLGLDAYLHSNFGLTAAVVSHVRTGDDDRVPHFWAELLFGFRFGL